MSDRYVPAAGRKSFQSLYDPIVALTMREGTFRDNFVKQVLGSDDPADLLIADVGAGTGTLAIALAESGATVIAVDGDPAALNTARGKDGADEVDFREGLADDLPIEDDSVDLVVMSLLLHHLSSDDKRRALAEARRVLKPDGKLHIADWGRPGDPVMRVAFFALQLVDGFENTRELGEGGLVERLAGEGYESIKVHSRLRTGWGRLEMLSASPDQALPVSAAYPAVET